jgi:hypothetical protein
MVHEKDEENIYLRDSNKKIFLIMSILYIINNLF